MAKVVYNIAAVFSSILNLLVFGWLDYFSIFKTYFDTFDIVGKIGAVILFALLIAVPVLIVLICVHRWRVNHQLKHDDTSNKAPYREIGRLNKQVLDLMDEKNKVLALKVNAMGGTERIPYMGASALVDDTLPTVGNVVGGAAAGAAAAGEGVADAAAAMAKATVEAKTLAEEREIVQANRFPKLSLVDLKYRDFVPPTYDNEISLVDFVEGYRAFACGEMQLYYTPEIVRCYVAGMAASKLLILEGISGTGKTSLPYSFSRYLDNPATIVSVQPSYRDRTEVMGYFNEFSKRFNETEFLRAMYEAGLRPDPSTIVLDEMNLARVEYYFAEILSVLEMPSHDEWVLDLVPTAWAGDPKGLHDGKITVPDSLWFVGTVNNDDSTFTITDKVYDRAIPIELNERADAFECPAHARVRVTAEHLQYLFQKAKAVVEAADARVEEAQREAASRVDAARSACEAEVADVRSDAAAAAWELEGVRQQAADDKQAALDAAAVKHAAELERANAEAQRKIAELTATLQQVKRSLERAEKRAEGNSLSRYLLARLRGEEVPDSADDGDSKGGKR